jgi:hypothetical protein
MGRFATVSPSQFGNDLGMENLDGRMRLFEEFEEGKL